MLYIPWNLDDKRTTMDLDLLGFGSPDLENLSQAFRQICEVEIADDGLTFDRESVNRATPIREESVYDGVRVVVRVALGTMLIRLQVDVGFGDQSSEPQTYRIPDACPLHGPAPVCSSPDNRNGGKVEAMVRSVWRIAE